MKKAILIISLAALAAGVLFAVTSNTVLIATENTAYKNQLVEVLSDKLEAEGLQVEVIDHARGELDDVDPSDYAIVYVLNSGAQAKVRPQVIDWLDSVSGNDDNVIVHTTKRTVWDEDLPVDTISSASKRNNIDDVTDDILDLVKENL